MIFVYFNSRGMVSRRVFFYQFCSLYSVCKLWARI